MEILKRGSAYALTLPSIVHHEVSHVSPDDRFAALQIDCYVRGWERDVGSHEVA